jgi:hypothetical protein
LGQLQVQGRSNPAAPGLEAWLLAAFNPLGNTFEVQLLLIVLSPLKIAETQFGGGLGN